MILKSFLLYYNDISIAIIFIDIILYIICYLISFLIRKTNEILSISIILSSNNSYN